jgi:hypothetical protein
MGGIKSVTQCCKDANEDQVKEPAGRRRYGSAVSACLEMPGLGRSCWSAAEAETDPSLHSG